MKIENSNVNDNFSVSQKIGDKLLQGWTLLNSTCHICNITPLIKQKSKEERFCALCNIYIKLKKSENEEDVNEVKELNEKKEDKENVNDPIKYVKEIKLQNEEFNELLNKNHISKDDIQNLFEYKNYIKERCGYNVCEWLKLDKVYNNNEIKNKKAHLENENFHLEKYENNDFIKGENQDLKTLEENNISKNMPLFNRSDILGTKIYVLNKTKNVLIDKLEKYSEILSRCNNKNDEIELINTIVNIVTILEKVNSI